MPRSRRAVLGAGAALLVLLAGTAALVPFRDRLSVPTVVLIYLLPVLLAAAVGGLRPAAVVATAAALTVNWHFVPPYRTLAVSTGDDLAALVVYLLAAAATGLAVDRTAARSAEAEQLAGVDRMRIALLGAVGHDLRTPLAGIKAAVSSLRQPDVRFSEADHADLLATVEESADRLTGVVDNLLALNRLRAGVLCVDLAPVDLDAVAAQAALASGARTGSVRLDVPDNLPAALADAGLLDRVLVNLITNAAAVSPVVTLRGARCGDRLKLTVADHGPGIPAADRDAAFAPFHRLGNHDGDGLGLGLAIARGFTEAQGGTLEAGDTPGGGLTMTVTLPVAHR